MTTGVFIAVSADHQLRIVESLAREIWTEHYTPLIGTAQVEYMLDRFQSRIAIAGQIKAGVLYFLIRKDNKHIGYIAVQPRGDELFLSKIYITAVERGKGFGKRAIVFAEKLARERNLHRIVLTVNKNNAASIKAYEKFGFQNIGPVVQDIGNGFVMDDYRMAKILRGPLTDRE
jgi:RimJ/RimL family protein N-acetyltransferase